MSKRVEEFVKSAKEMDEMAKVKMDAICKLKNEVDEIADKRAIQCAEFFKECTEDEYNELLTLVSEEDKIMYAGMRALEGLNKVVEEFLENSEQKEEE